MVMRGHGVDVWRQNMQETPASGGFPMAEWVKNLPAVQETRVPSLGQEEFLEKEMATHSRILA